MSKEKSKLNNIKIKIKDTTNLIENNENVKEKVNKNEAIITKLNSLLINSFTNFSTRNLFYEINSKFLEGIYFLFSIIKDFETSELSLNKNFNFNFNKLNYSIKDIIFFNCMEDVIDISEEISSKIIYNK